MFLVLVTGCKNKTKRTTVSPLGNQNNVEPTIISEKHTDKHTETQTEKPTNRQAHTKTDRQGKGIPGPANRHRHKQEYSSAPNRGSKHSHY